jgi:phosphoribosylformylglycinamidine synthase
VSSAHDLSEGGLAQALVEACLIGGTGAGVQLPGDPFVALFSESSARAIVAAADVDAVLALASKHQVTASVIGQTGGHSLSVAGLFDVSIEQLREQSEGTLPALFG